MTKTLLISISTVILLAVGGGAFYGGTIYSKSQNARVFNVANFQGVRGNRTAGLGNFILGDIISKDSSSITLKLPNSAGSRIIFYSDITQISKTTTGTANDLVAGTSVSVTGATNPDGSVTAQTIQIRPLTQNRVQIQ